MAARYDILRELGLLPLWRLRAVGRGAEARTVSLIRRRKRTRDASRRPQPSREPRGSRTHIAAWSGQNSRGRRACTA